MESLSSRERPGFTFVEMLVCIVIVATVWAITLPIMSSAKRAAKKTECVSNLHQMGIAFALYREDEGISTPTGNRFELGLPSDDGLAPIISPFRCHADFTEHTPPGYVFIVPEPTNTSLLAGWSQYNKVMQDRSVILVDFRHNSSEDYVYKYFPKTGLGLTLDGQVIIRRHSGNAMSYDWWLDSKP